MATIRLMIEELALHEVEVEVDGDLLEAAELEGFECSAEGAAEYLAAGGDAEYWYVDQICDGTVQAVEAREVRKHRVI